jgi:hypothetical protein
VELASRTFPDKKARQMKKLIEQGMRFAAWSKRINSPTPGAFPKRAT